MIGLSVPDALADTTDTFTFRTLLSSANEVPPVTELDASGVATVWMHVVRDTGGNMTSGSVDFRVDYSFPGSVEITGLHIHNAEAGVNAGVVIPAPGISGTESIMDETGTGTIFRQMFVSSSNTTAFDAMVALLSQPDQFYVSLHTRVNPGGAIRGQLSAADVMVVRAAMSPANEVPPIEGLDADGSASVTVYATRDSAGTITSASVNFDVQYRFGGEVEITGLHIHNAGAGVNAGVVIPAPGISGTNSIMDPGGAGTISRQAEVGPEDAAGLEALEAIFWSPNQFYLNLHTATNSGGALRDQLQRTDTVVLRAEMSPANEVPPVTDLEASAAAKFTLFVTRDEAGEITSGTVVFDVSFEFPAGSEFTGLHIHQGTADVSGGVFISSGLTGSSSIVSEEGNGNIFRPVNVPATNATGVDTLNSLLANPEGWYLNLHTTVHPGGAVRGQTVLPGEPELEAYLNPGSYVTEVTVGDGQPDGVWGMITLVGDFLEGGYNLGGGFGGRGIPGFGAFPLTETTTVTLSLSVAALPGEAEPAFLFSLLDSQRQLVGEEVSGTGTALITRSLPPGFYVVAVRSQAGAGTFQLDMEADTLPFGAIAGGYGAPGITGFGSFTLNSKKKVRIQVFGKNFYNPFGTGNLTLTLKDSDGAVRARAQ